MNVNSEAKLKFSEQFYQIPKGIRKTKKNN